MKKIAKGFILASMFIYASKGIGYELGRRIGKILQS